MTKIVTDGSIEMAWKVFAGPYDDVFLALLKQRCKRDGLKTDPDTLSAQFRLHVHRGIAYLAADKRIKGIDGLLIRLNLAAIAGKRK